jgi:hypothetical protein
MPPLVRPIAVVLTLVGALAAASKPPRVEYRDDRVTVFAEDSPVKDVLEQIRRQSGAELRGEPASDAPVTVRLESVPLREALERLLGERSFTLTYGDKGALKAIELKGGPHAAPAPAEEKKRPVAMNRKQMWDGVAHVFDRADTIPLSGKLAMATGSNEGHFLTLMQAASGCTDRICRREAWRAGLRALESDQEMRNAFLAATGQMDDAELAALARAMAAQTPDGAEDIVKQVIRDSRVPEVRSRARAVLVQLRADRDAMTATR